MSLKNRQKSNNDGEVRNGIIGDSSSLQSSQNQQQQNNSSQTSSTTTKRNKDKNHSSSMDHNIGNDSPNKNATVNGGVVQPVKKVQPILRRSYSSDPPPTPRWVYISLILCIIISIVTIPQPFHPEANTVPTVKHVFYYGWMTCMSTGLGALPFYIFPDVATFWIGISNAVAAGMMVAASYTLFAEGCTYHDPQDTSTINPIWRTLMGSILGLIFILATKSFLDQHEDIKIGALGGTDARKALLIFFVMTLHSFSEGVGVGVSFGGLHGSELGVFISASLAVHNVPEGLAIAVSLIARGLSITTAAVWAIATSLPQPFMAVPAYYFVNTFIPILPVGLGFAGGAMAWVAFVELLVEAIEDTSIVTTLFVSIPSCALMLLAQHSLK